MATAVLVVLGVIALVAGLFTLSQATMGAGLIAAACFLGILARITQADGQEKRRRKEAPNGVA